MQDFGPDVTLNEVGFVHPSAQIYGKVQIGEGSSVWPNVVMRSESHEINIGKYTNIQDFTMVHVGERSSTHIGDYCSITHHATIHGCTIGDNCLIGINATVMDGCVVGDNCIVAGGAFLTEGTHIPDNSVVVGMPAKVIRTQNNWLKNRLNAFMYAYNATRYAQGEHRAWSGPEFETLFQQESARLQAEYTEIFGSNV